MIPTIWWEAEEEPNFEESVQVSGPFSRVLGFVTLVTFLRVHTLGFATLVAFLRVHTLGFAMLVAFLRVHTLGFATIVVFLRVSTLAFPSLNTIPWNLLIFLDYSQRSYINLPSIGGLSQIGVGPTF